MKKNEQSVCLCIEWFTWKREREKKTASSSHYLVTSVFPRRQRYFPTKENELPRRDLIFCLIDEDFSMNIDEEKFVFVLDDWDTVFLFQFSSSSSSSSNTKKQSLVHTNHLFYSFVVYTNLFFLIVIAIAIVHCSHLSLENEYRQSEITTINSFDEWKRQTFQ